tara:strand:+ start:32 stop:2554 length:2523 start_codon:yes stop_codon:yes gene_type:complete
MKDYYMWGFRERTGLDLVGTQDLPSHLEDKNVIWPKDIETLVEKHPELHKIWDKIPKWATKCDIARYLFLYYNTGTYLDADCTKLKSLPNNTLDSNNVILYTEHIDTPTGPREDKGVTLRIANFVLTSTKIHQGFWMECINESIKRVKSILDVEWTDKDVLWSAGPGMISEVYHNLEDKSGITVLDDTYVEHKAWGSWRSNIAIPKVIMQTYASSDELTPQMIDAMHTWKNMNPGWDYESFDNNECIEFITKHFNTDTVKAFNNLIPGAFKADLFRYCYLYIKGGVYSDIDNICLVPLNEFLYDNDTFVSVKDRVVDGQDLVYNAFMATEKNHPVLKKAIDLTVYNALNSIYPKTGNNIINMLSISGPKCLATALDSCKETKFRLLDIVDTGVHITHIKTSHGKMVMKVKYDGYEVENSYWDLYSNKRVYKNHTYQNPLVSCLCVTKNKLVKNAIDYFHLQTYDNKELILVTETSNKNLSYLKEVAASNDNIHLIETKDNITLGELRNISVREASGEYVIQWDDDDIYHEKRIEAMQKILARHSSVNACFLKTFKVYDKATGITTLSKNWGGVEGSMIARKSTMPNYEPLSKGEDTPVRDYFLNNHKGVVINDPDLYTYVIHGDNTWDREHSKALMLPLISCLCPTKNKPSIVKDAIECFKNQTYANKELILVTDEENPYMSDIEGFVEENIKLVKAPRGTILGALRNISVDNARGEYIAIWDDDDICHNDRLQMQFNYLEGANKKACFLKRVLFHDITSGDKGILKEWWGNEASMLVLKSEMPRYNENLAIGEDTPIKTALMKSGKGLILDQPQLYIYRFHGNNTCEQRHLKSRIDTII